MMGHINIFLLILEFCVYSDIVYITFIYCPNNLGLNFVTSFGKFYYSNQSMLSREDSPILPLISLQKMCSKPKPPPDSTTTIIAVKQLQGDHF